MPTHIQEKGESLSCKLVEKEAMMQIEKYQANT
jgi:hypothetical protein